MRIGIITCWNSTDNYGQQMQVFALQHYLRSLGHDAFLIKYSPLQYTSKYSLYKGKTKLYIKSIIKRIIPLLRKKDQGFGNVKYMQVLQKKNKRRRFVEFRDKYLQSTEKVYFTLKELQKDPPVADAYITGSDQVWHDSLFYQGAAGYFLNFGKKNARRISYAASIGRIIPKEESSLFKKFLSYLDKISVREESALKECYKVGVENVKIVIDPTFLLPIEGYDIIQRSEDNRFSEKPYLFMYILNVGTTKDTGWPLIEPYIKSEKLEVKVVASSGYLPAQELIPKHDNIYATIPEWLALIKNSKCVVTSSFHGVVFSILNHRPFMAILLKGQLAAANNRITNLLSQLKLSERILQEALPLKEQIERPIDWDEVDKTIKLLRISGIEFLREALTK